MTSSSVVRVFSTQNLNENRSPSRVEAIIANPDWTMRSWIRRFSSSRLSSETGGSVVRPR